MKILLKVLLISLFLPASTVSLAEPLSAEKKQRIGILINKTGGNKIAQLVANQFIRLSNASLQRTNPDVDTAVFALISEEVNSVISAEVANKNAVNEMFYPIYHEHLTLAEISEIINFYDTPLGKKMLSVMPEITREGMEAARSWGQSMAPEIRKRLETRFEKEGIKYR